MEKYITSVKSLFEYYKKLGDKTMDQLTEEELFIKMNNDSNSISIIVNHLWGNMMSRWTKFLEEDGEKEWRDRDAEFEDIIRNKEDLLKKWEEGWQTLFAALDEVSKENIDSIVYIRNLGHTIPEAINRQLGHYAYHVGQMVFIGKMIKKSEWTSLSIPKGKSKEYNKKRFLAKKKNINFVDQLKKEE